MAINFWIPTYLTEHLSVTENAAKAIYSAMSFIKSFTPFITLFAAVFKKKDIKMARVSFVFGTLFMIGMYFISAPYLNILCLLLAQIAIGIASSLVWSIYIPSQRESGMVSTINGVLDSSGYLFASITNMIVAHAVGSFGWEGVIFIWFSLTALGIVAAMFTKEKNPD